MSQIILRMSIRSAIFLLVKQSIFDFLWHSAWLAMSEVMRRIGWAHYSFWFICVCWWNRIAFCQTIEHSGNVLIRTDKFHFAKIFFAWTSCTSSTLNCARLQFSQSANWRVKFQLNLNEFCLQHSINLPIWTGKLLAGFSHWTVTELPWAIVKPAR